jgi:ComF family protein
MSAPRLVPVDPQTRAMEGLMHTLVSILFPPRCLLCDAPGAEDLDICAGCRGALPMNRRPCLRCGLPSSSGPVARCGACLRKPPPFARTVAPLRYAFPVDRLVLGLKFGHRLANARLLGTLLADALTDAPRPALLLPVPLHRARLAERGFNQATELARFVARRLDLPIEHDRVRRVRETPAQTGLRRSARRRNLRDAFEVRGRLPRRIAVVDDVMTTGSTAAELARALVRAGVDDVSVWCVARAE